MVQTGAVARSRGAPRLLALVLASGVLAAACASSGYQYVKNSDDQNYFKVPDGWKLYEEDAVLKRLDLSPRELEIERETTWRVSFDANPKPSLKHLEQIFPSHPTGRALVLELDQESSDTVSIQSLRNLFFDFDTAYQQDQATALEYEPLELDGGFRGIHIVAEITDPKKGKVLVFNQKTVLDQRTTKLYTLVVSCEASCYEKNQDKIEKIVDSWTVED